MIDRSEESTSAIEEFDEFGDFGIDDLNDSDLQQLEKIETQFSIPTNTTSRKAATSSLSKHALANRSPSRSAAGARSASALISKQPAASSSRLSVPGNVSSFAGRGLQRTSSGSGTSQGPSPGSRQMTLFGKPAVHPETTHAKPSAGVTESPGHITFSSQTTTIDRSSQSAKPFVAKTQIKTWDRNAYLHRENAKNRAIDVDLLDSDDNSGAEEDWDANSKYKNVKLPEPASIPRDVGPPLPQKHQIDRKAAETWIYPMNKEKRDYQFNIVQKALFNNVLVALPTGLGKTLIAAVVILNFFRWFPQGKILFLAPTRPLVDQQKKACHGTCGLPWDCAIDLTGGTTKARREEFWQTKRIFYMTPQTCENDIRNGSCDPRDVVCVVVDEAHRAQGRYAYGNVIGLLMEKNPHFRVLGLSATPGKDAEKVQEVVDQLHINEIEIRTEEAIDVRQYVFRKKEEVVNVSLGRDLNKIKDDWAKLMQVHMDPLINAGLFRYQDPVFLHHFAINSIARDPNRRNVLASKPYLRSHIAELAQMALSMQYLMEQSVKMFYDRLKERSMGVNDKGKKTSTSKQKVYSNNNTTFKEIVRDLEMMQDAKGRILHPKMLKLRDVLVDHFDRHAIARMEHEEAVAESGRDILGGTPNLSATQNDTRAMVFCSYRDCCAEIVSYLNDCGLKATQFVGQSRDKSGNKGMSQKEQEKVIQDFKSGVYNVLVATSIGEEGLDIGSVDLTVCYEAVKDSIRMLQRIGRTGRKREGKIVVLMSEGREQHNWQHSKDNYKAVQKDINSKMHVELFDDVDRMVPDDIHPRPLLQMVEEPDFETYMVDEGKKTATKGRASGSKPARAKKDPKRNVPDGALLTFVRASKLTTRDDDDSDGDDEQAERPEETHSQRLRRVLEEESDDGWNVENSSLSISKPSAGKEVKTTKTSQKRKQLSVASSVSTPPLTHMSIQRDRDPRRSQTKTLGTFLRSSGAVKTQSTRSSGASPRAKKGKQGTQPTLKMAAGQDPGPELDIDEFDMEDEVLHDPDLEAFMERAEQVAIEEVTKHSKIPEELLNPIAKSPPSSPVMPWFPRPHPLVLQLQAEGDVIEMDQDDDPSVVEAAEPSRITMGPPNSVPRQTGSSRNGRAATQIEDPTSSSPIKPPQQKRRLTRPARSSPRTPSPTKRAAKRQTKKRKVLIVEEEEEEHDENQGKNGTDGKASRIDLQVGKKERGGKLKKRKITNSPTSRALFQYEADRSTDEEVHGERDEDDEGIGSSGEDDDDRAAVGDFLPTQGPRGYHQQSVYMQSIMSQRAPAEFQRFNRAPFPGVGGRFGIAPDESPTTPQRIIRRFAAMPSSENRTRTNDSDRYSEDSFVVNDEEDIVFDSGSDGLPDSSQF